jgi:hypothetical protein
MIFIPSILFLGPKICAADEPANTATNLILQLHDGN